MNAFHWNTGQPSVCAPLQSAATIARKASEHNARKIAAGNFNEPLVAKKSTRKPEMPKQRLPRSGKTKPLVERLDFDAVREYRLSGKSWEQAAEHFGCSKRSLHENMVRKFPELRGRSIVDIKPCGVRPRPMPLEKISKEILAGASLRGSAIKYGFSHVSLRYRLMQTQDGVRALRAARVRSGQGEA